MPEATGAEQRTLNVTSAIFDPWDTPDAEQQPAIHYRGTVWSYRRLISEINRAGNALKALGVRREERILLIAYDSPHFVALMYGAMKIGAVPIPVNPYLPLDDYAYFLEDSRAKLLAVEPEIWHDLAPRLADRAPDVSLVMILPGLSTAQLAPSGHPGPFVFYEDFVPRMAPELEAAATSPDEAAFWLYSSGSTGKPKGAVHCHKDMIFCNDTYGREVLAIARDDVLFSASKLYFAYGLGNGSYFAFANGASVVLMPEKVEPVLVLDTIERTSPTLFFGVPTLYNAMLRVQTREYSFPSLRACVSAGEPLPAEIFLRWQERYGVEIVDGIGSTEVLHIYISNRLGSCRPGASGLVVPGYEVKIVDEGGVPVPQGEIGDLYVKGGSVAAFYWNQTAKTQSAMVGEWYRTGDKYYMDPDGYYCYAGRSDDMMKVGGMWVSPSEVENALLRHDAVAEAAVVAVPDAAGLDKPVAHVILNVGHVPSKELEDSLRSFARDQLAHFKVPRAFYFVDELPKTATGKIQRYKLRTGLAAQR